MKTTWAERVAIGVASLVLSVGLIVLLSGYFTNHDQGSVSGSENLIGLSFPDLGDARLESGELRPLYNSFPPTSGPHFDVPVTRNETELSDDQILQALSEGDIVIIYGGRHPPSGLAELARSVVGGRFTPALATSGQAVIMARRPGTIGLIGLAWTRIVTVSAPNDSLLRQFAAVWLGKGASAQ